MKTNLLILALASTGAIVAQSQGQSETIEQKKLVTPKAAKIIVLDRKEVKPGKKASSKTIEGTDDKGSLKKEKITKTKSEQ